MYICISEATIYDPDTGILSNMGNSSCSHKGAGCALYYSPIHMNRPTVFIGGSSDSPYENCAEVLDYTTTNSNRPFSSSLCCAGLCVVKHSDQNMKFCSKTYIERRSLETT